MWWLSCFDMPPPERSCVFICTPVLEGRPGSEFACQSRTGCLNLLCCEDLRTVCVWAVFTLASTKPWIAMQRKCRNRKTFNNTVFWDMTTLHFVGNEALWRDLACGYSLVNGASVSPGIHSGLNYLLSSGTHNGLNYLLSSGTHNGLNYVVSPDHTILVCWQEAGISNKYIDISFSSVLKWRFCLNVTEAPER